MLEDGHSNLTARSVDILNTMFLLCKHLSLYSEENNVVQQTTNKLLNSIEEFHSQGGDLLVTVAKHGFMIQGELISRRNQLFTSFARRMFQHGISSFSLLPGVTVPSIYTFLRILLRNPAETWDEGGIGASLAKRNVAGIVLTEMSESDFRLLNSEESQVQEKELRPSSDIWLNFARSIFNSLTGEELESLSDETSAAELAERISETLSGRPATEQDQLTQELSRFATSLQREKKKTARTEALLCLADFVNNLSPDMRKSVLGDLSKLQVPKEFTEEFFNGLSDQAIVEAFRQVTSQHGYTPPVVLSLVSKLAGDRKLVPETELAAQAIAREKSAQQIKELFRPDEFNKYVPSRYQKALMQVLNNQQLPTGLTDKLQELKKSLEDFRQEQQMSRLSLHILYNNPDAEYIDGLRERLIASMQFYLDASDYTSLINLCRTCFEGKPEEETRPLIDLIPDSFTEQVLGDTPRLGKDYQPQVAEVIALIGAPFVRPLLEHTATESDRSIRFFYLTCLRKLGGKVADHAVLFLGDERWFVQRNMLILLGELGAVDKLPKIRPLLNHNHQKVRQEALKTCLLLQDEESIQKLIKNLFSRNRQEVIHAITMSQLVDNENLSAKLISMLRENRLFHFDLDIKKALVHALAEHNNPAALTLFSEMLNASRLFKAAPFRKLKVEIIKALGKYPAAKVSLILKQHVDNEIKEVATQARQTLKKLAQEEG